MTHPRAPTLTTPAPPLPPPQVVRSYFGPHNSAGGAGGSGESDPPLPRALQLQQQQAAAAVGAGGPGGVQDDPSGSNAILSYRRIELDVEPFDLITDQVGLTRWRLGVPSISCQPS